MADSWRGKGLDPYKAEPEAVSEKDIIAVLERYKRTTADIQRLLLDARSVLSLCSMVLHYRKFPRPSYVRDQLKGIQTQASALSLHLAELSLVAANGMAIAAYVDDNVGMAGLERGDPYAKEQRLNDAAVMVEALARWAERALEASQPVKSGQPTKEAWRPLWATLAALYKQLAGRNPTRNMKPSKAHPHGQVEEGEFRRFANDLMDLAGYSPPTDDSSRRAFSEDDLKKGKASLMENMSEKNHQYSPLDVSGPVDPEQTAQAQDGPERLQGSNEND